MADCVSFSLVQPRTCPSGWYYQYGSSCYKFSSEMVSWYEAVRRCKSLGGFLVKIGDADEQSFLTDRINISRKIKVCLQLPEYHFTMSFTLWQWSDSSNNSNFISNNEDVIFGLFIYKQYIKNVKYIKLSFQNCSSVNYYRFYLQKIKFKYKINKLD